MSTEIGIELNTNLIQIFNGTYESRWEPEETNDDGEELQIEYDFKNLMKSIVDVYNGQSENIIQSMDIDFIKKITFTDSYSPREYNFSTDTLDFTLTVDNDKMIKKLESLKHNADFESFLRDNYTSFDGFISFTPNSIQGIYTSIIKEDDDYARSIGAFISFLLGEELMDEIEEDVCEFWRCNGYSGLDYTVIE